MEFRLVMITFLVVIMSGGNSGKGVGGDSFKVDGSSYLYKM